MCNKCGTIIWSRPLSTILLGLKLFYLWLSYGETVYNYNDVHFFEHRLMIFSVYSSIVCRKTASVLKHIEKYFVDTTFTTQINVIEKPLHRVLCLTYNKQKHVIC